MLLETCRMCCAFQPLWEKNLGSNLRNPDSTAKLFWIWVILIWKMLNFCEFVVRLLWMILIWIVFNLEGIAGAFEACVGH